MKFNHAKFQYVIGFHWLNQTKLLSNPMKDPSTCVHFYACLFLSLSFIDKT